MPLASGLETSLMRCSTSPKSLSSALSPCVCHLQESVGAGRFWLEYVFYWTLLLQDYEVPDISETSPHFWMWSPDLCPFSPPFIHPSMCGLEHLFPALVKQQIGFTSTSEAHSKNYLEKIIKINKLDSPPHQITPQILSTLWPWEGCNSCKNNPLQTYQ